MSDAPDRILRIRAVLDRTGLSRSTLYRKVKEGSFPKQVQIATRCTGWRESAVLHWMRAPSHAPEVVTEIERIVRLAAPYPVPARMGHVTYTDTWLWHKSGLFQLDTLTEGQL